MIKTYNKLVRDRIPEIIEASGKSCKTEILSNEEYLEMLKVFVSTGCAAAVYTQTTDVEIEVNGLMTYDRKFKFDPEIFCKINNQKAAIEE